MTVEIQTRKLTGVTWVSEQLVADFGHVYFVGSYAKLLHDMFRSTPAQNIRRAALSASDAYSKMLLTGIE